MRKLEQQSRRSGCAPRRLIRNFDVHHLKFMLLKLAKFEITRFYVASVAVQTSLLSYLFVNINVGFSCDKFHLLFPHYNHINSSLSEVEDRGKGIVTIFRLVA